MWERWTSAWEGRLHVQLSGAGVSQQERGVAVLLGSSCLLLLNFQNPGISSRHILNIPINPRVLGKILEKLASEM